MKSIFKIVAFIFCFTAFSQNKVSQKVQELNATNSYFKSFSPLSANNSLPSNQIEKVVSGAQLAYLSKNVLNEIVANRYDLIELQLPYHNETLTVQLYQVNPFSEGFHVDTDKQINIAYNPGVYYRGILKNQPNSIVSFNFFENDFNGMISSSDLSNLVVGKLDQPNNVSDYILYEDQKMNVLNDAECHTSDEVSKDFEEQIKQSKSPNTLKCVAAYFEIDNALYVANDSNTTTTTNWMTSVFNNMQTLYANDGITVALKSIYIWTSADPYEGIGTSSSAYLNKFKQVRPVFDGDVGQLVGIDPGGLGGVSMGIGGLCTNNNYVYSDVNLSYSSVPTYSWTIMVVTHEFGHNLGSRHTHACVWNGNNTAIDNCAPYAMGSSSEGFSCMTNPPTIPSTSVKGTIMSYCHLISGVGISFNNGFGPQPSTAISNFINSRTCLSSNCINICVNGVTAIDVNNVAGSNSTVITWSDIAGSSSWKVAVLPLSTGLTIWNTASTNSYTANNLLPNTYYRFKIKPECGSLTPSTKEYIFLTSANYCDGIVLTDTGGANSNYSDNQSFVRSIIPNIPNNKIKLEFNSFSLEEDYDFLYVYDGSSTASPAFNANGFTGNAIPGPFESTASDGALTIRFYSDEGVNSSGWLATTACLNTLGVSENSYIDYSYYPNPSNGIVNVNSRNIISDIMVYNIEGRLLLSKSVNDLNTQVDISSFSNGTYFVKMNIENQTVTFKVLKM